MVTVVGLGFVGLTTALGFAEMGHKVYGVEADNTRRDLIAQGKLPFFEPGLDRALERHLNQNFIPCRDIAAAVAESTFVYYCVGTPYGPNGEADLTHLFGAVEQTLKAIQKGDGKYRVLVTKSTIPPSTTAERIIPFVEEQGWQVGQEIGVANNPEFLREGHCWEDFTQADRIVLGVADERSKELLEKLYANSKCPVLSVSPNTGEYVKYLSNTLLATMISYSNEMAAIADVIGGVDVAAAFRILHMDKRWGGGSMKSYVYPGCGYGGYCLPKDTQALYALANNKGMDAPILKNVIQTNGERPQVIAQKIMALLTPSQAVGVLGLSFKPLSDDVRDTPAAKVIDCLIRGGYTRICAYDPIASAEFAKHYPHLPVELCASVEQVIAKADALAILTGWDEFKSLGGRTEKPIVDGRYLL